MIKRKLTLVTGLLAILMAFGACNKPAETPESATEVTEEVKANNHDDHDHDDDDDHDHDHDDHDHDHDHDDHDHHDEEAREDVALSDWDGAWNSVESYINDEEVKEAMEKEAEEHGKDLDAYISEKMENRKFDHGGLVVDGDKITYFKGKVDESEEDGEVEYKFLEAVPMEHGGVTMYWYVFENQGEEGDKYLALMDVHGEDTMAHFHMRTGDDKEKLTDGDSHWYPTFVRASNPASVMADFLSR